MRAQYLEDDDTRVILKTEGESPVIMLHIDDFSDLFGIDLEIALKKKGENERTSD